MKTRRNTGGFTLLELALAVALISILSGVTAVNVVHYQRTLTQVELDGIAREIFVAAQNHLTMAESQDFMGVANTSFGETYTKTEEEAATNNSEMYYYVVDERVDNATPDMLDLMLPFASVDETVRQKGSYVIRYQKDPALVLDVFYAPQSGRFPHTFTEDEVSSDWIQEYRGPDKKQARGDYEDEHIIIGWYGVEPEWLSVQSGGDGGGDPTPVQKGEPLSPPTVKIVNAEQLYVEVTNPNRVDREKPETSEWYGNARLHLEITGSQSGKSFPIELIGNAGFPSEQDYISIRPDDDQFYPKTYRVILDDVTQDGTRFQKIMQGAGLYPGEDIVIRAVSYNNTELTNIATSASSTTNSLFASVSEDTTTANIANFRHLENLDYNISHVGSGASTTITGAKQTSDMDWDKFVENVKKLKQEEGKPQKVQVYNDDTNSKDGYYLPIQNQSTIEYVGEVKEGGTTRAAKISNVKIDVPGDAGLFATLGHSSTVTDLQLVNFDVKSSDGRAGALAGLLDGSHVGGADIPGVLAYGVASTITGKTFVGGLVGELKGACTIAQSAAAVYVTSNNGDAGGLIGTVSVDATATVTDSYAGGHTTGGGHYATDNCNVTAGASAGGFIGGSYGSLTVQNCYTTASAKADANAGGFIGDVEGGTITSCYATGYVTGDTDAKKGAFAGKVDGTSFSDSGYFSAVENEAEDKDKEPDKRLHPVGQGSGGGIAKFDQDYDKYGYGPVNPVPNAKPYDNLGDKYTFQTISQWTGKQDNVPEWISTHYGDWPKWDEVLVVNELAS